MKDHSLTELRKLNESYIAVLEAQARPTAYKNLTPEQAEELAKLSPSYSSPQVWGNTSNWICSAANRMMKFRNIPFEQAYETAKSSQKDIADFERFSKALKRDIQSFQTFEDLSRFMSEARSNGSMTQGLSKEAKNDGRARQCYSLIKNGIAENKMSFVYEDDEWLIAYPFDLEYNKKFSAIGKWCHTGSFGDAETYWRDYAQTPIYYLLNKKVGYVLCASYGHSEVRNQLDNYPDGFGHAGSASNWKQFFTGLGLQQPMIDHIDKVEYDYAVPEDATGGSVWERVDEYMVQENLFADMSINLEEDDGGGSGNFYLTTKIDAVDPNGDEGDGNHLYTRYSKDVDAKEFYTFEEFKLLNQEVWRLGGDHISYPILETIVSQPQFVSLWNTAVEIPYYSWGGERRITDDRTMADRFSIEELVRIIKGELDANDYGYDLDRKVQDIINCFTYLFQGFKTKFSGLRRDMFRETNGSVDIWDDTLQISIDADEGQHLAEQVRDGTTGITFEGKPDILAVNLKGKSSFAMKRVDFSEFKADINNCIATIKYYCHNTKDIEGQQTFELSYPDGRTFYYGGDKRYS